MTLAGALKTAAKSSLVITWRPVMPSFIERTGVGLHSGKASTVKIWPELARKGRYFDFKSNIICASIGHTKQTPMCTSLCKDGYSVRTVEHLLSALEGIGVDNCRIEIHSSVSDDSSVEVPILDGSAKEWVDGIHEVVLKVAVGHDGKSPEKLAPYLNEPVSTWMGGCRISAFPYPRTKIRYGIDYPKVEKMRDAGLIRRGSEENAIMCSETRGWVNPPLRIEREPCRHKMLDLIGDLSLLAQDGNQGMPIADILAFQGEFGVHAQFVRQLKEGVTAFHSA